MKAWLSVTGNKLLVWRGRPSKDQKLGKHHLNSLSVESVINRQPCYNCFPLPSKPMSLEGCCGALMDHITGKMCCTSRFGPTACWMHNSLSQNTQNQADVLLCLYNVCVCVCVFVPITNWGPNTHCSSKVRIFLRSGDVFAGLHSFKRLFEGFNVEFTIGFSLE